MSNLNVKASEKIALAGFLGPVAVVNSEQFSTVVDLAAYNQVMGIAMFGDMASETIQFTCYRCASDGSSAVSLKASTLLAASTTANDSKQLVINVTVDELIASAAEYVKFGLVTGSTVGGVCAIAVLGTDAHFQPVANPASVLEVKA